MATQALTFRYEDTFGPFPDAYETLIRDIIEGDPTLFVHAEEAEEAWRIYEAILDNEDVDVHQYASGTWGPDDAGRLVHAPPPEEADAPVGADC